MVPGRVTGCCGRRPAGMLRTGRAGDQLPSEPPSSPPQPVSACCVNPAPALSTRSGPKTVRYSYPMPRACHGWTRSAGSTPAISISVLGCWRNSRPSCRQPPPQRRSPSSRHCAPRCSPCWCTWPAPATYGPGWHGRLPPPSLSWHRSPRMRYRTRSPTCSGRDCTRCSGCSCGCLVPRLAESSPRPSHSRSPLRASWP